ncbi:protein DMP2 [Ziziphus jujuba]|uniref:Protein DMP2 n=2 Tax=Ziziphus jujuba TaxID=326968 RepID=A0A6P4AIG3_ZIZJJ|nr:protein DMP2 [Ziziphus jujuba]KAH7522435.1 hypothetical protein FEM48_Zijuj07G0138100 [Ziziphus jujuba var. spinosa]
MGDSKSSGVTNKAYQGFGDLIKLLPTGTVFLFQFLNPVVTNNGKCSTANKYLDAILVIVCGLSCFFSCFTDSYTGSDGKIRYGFVTKNGLWSSTSTPSQSIDLSAYKLRLGDFVHAFFSVIVFAGLSLLDSNTVRCFYPGFESTNLQKTLLQVLPIVIGVLSSSVFVLFPNDRHGIGYPPSDSSSKKTSSNNSISMVENPTNK